MDGRRVGILGGGQLGRMMAEAGHRLGIQLNILDPGTCWWWVDVTCVSCVCTPRNDARQICLKNRHVILLEACLLPWHQVLGCLCGQGEPGVALSA